MQNNPPISIITPTYNSEKTILDTIRSIASQKNVIFEHIVVDGGSKDKTLSLIEDFYLEKNFFDYNINSEIDGGVYFAMNKGINKAKGKIIVILNSDDFFAYSYLLEDVQKIFDKGYDVIYGNIIIKDFNLEKVLRTWNVGEYNPKSFSKGWHPAHPSFFVSKHVYDKVGLFNTDFRIASDFDLMLRIFNSDFKTFYLDRVTTVMRAGGLSNSGILNISKGNLEVLRSFKLNGVKTSKFYTIKRLCSKLFQFLKL